jgi:hypothetical protein
MSKGGGCGNEQSSWVKEGPKRGPEYRYAARYKFSHERYIFNLLFFYPCLIFRSLVSVLLRISTKIENLEIGSETK